MSDHVLNVNTILHTKDGSKIGNAIVTGRYLYYWEITTDYGSKCKFTSEEIKKHFNIAWHNYSKEVHGYTCDEMQEMMSKGHKYRVDMVNVFLPNDPEPKSKTDLEYWRWKFAGMAVQGTNMELYADKFGNKWAEKVATDSVYMADALIKELQKEKA